MKKYSPNAFLKESMLEELHYGLAFKAYTALIESSVLNVILRHLATVCKARSEAIYHSLKVASTGTSIHVYRHTQPQICTI